MAVIGILLLLLFLFMLIGAVLGWTGASRASRLEHAVSRLEKRINQLELAGRREPPGQAATATTPAPAAPIAADTPSPRELPSAPPPLRPSPAAARPTTTPPAPPPSSHEPSFLERLVDNMRRNWMAWLGGVSVALAGIFLVSYTIEMGLLGPTARIALAVIAGLSLHAGAEYFRRRTGSAHPAFAAMAGGASITLYAAILAALELYELVSPGTAFVVLAIVSLATMALATVHGPLLAALGLLGAYIVPMLVVDRPDGVLVYLVYALIITTAGLFLIRFVYRHWLWFGTLAGALVWWLISFDFGDADGFRGPYLAALAYLALAIPSMDWTLTRPSDNDRTNAAIPINDRFTLPLSLITISVLALAQSVSIFHLGFTGFGEALLYWSPLTLIVLWAMRSRDALARAPWVLALTQLGAWFVWSLDGYGGRIRLTEIVEPFGSEFLAYALLTSALFSIGTALVRRGQSYTHRDGALIWLGPVFWLALSYLIVTDLSTRWEWAAATLVLGLLYMTAAGLRLNRNQSDTSAVWPILGAHLAYSLAAVMFFREATLTLALAAQLVSLAWLHRRFDLPRLEWLIKAVLALVVARLTLNPWLMTYPADVHWSLWTYGGSVLCCLAAARLTAEPLPIRQWLEAATLHLFVLFLGAETRYLLYDGNVFARELTLTEISIDATLWGALAISYFNRARHSSYLARLYVAASRVLMLLALACYAIALTFLNPLFGGATVASTPVFNLLLLAYGMPVLIAVAAWFLYDEDYRPAAAAIAGAGLFIFVSLEIRHLWHGALALSLGTSNGEIYTYSAVWLAMAVATMLLSTRLGSRDGYKAGTGLLCLVIAKIFVYDMAGLEGLLRAASFMGLGLALLGLAWLYQRTTRRPDGY